MEPEEPWKSWKPIYHNYWLSTTSFPFGWFQSKIWHEDVRLILFRRARERVTFLREQLNFYECTDACFIEDKRGLRSLTNRGGEEGGWSASDKLELTHMFANLDHIVPFSHLCSHLCFFAFWGLMLLCCCQAAHPSSIWFHRCMKNRRPGTQASIKNSGRHMQLAYTTLNTRHLASPWLFQIT